MIKLPPHETDPELQDMDDLQRLEQQRKSGPARRLGHPLVIAAAVILIGLAIAWLLSR
jgi:hypothetical protein